MHVQSGQEKCDEPHTYDDAGVAGLEDPYYLLQPDSLSQSVPSLGQVPLAGPCSPLARPRKPGRCPRRLVFPFVCRFPCLSAIGINPPNVNQFHRKG